MINKKTKAKHVLASHPALKSPKVFVGVSGGVDSSVALALLKKGGYDVTGVFLKVWHPDFLPCDWKEERRSAMRVCATLGVPFMTLDCELEYKKEVVDYMISEYRNGRTPNPDVFCNKYVKFGVFLKKAIEMGADFVATGHYAQILKSDDNFSLLEGIDDDKDQSYFLYTLGQYELEHSLFPVGNMKKTEVRKLADNFKLTTATKKDSQGVCFLENIDIKDFLTHYIETKRGEVLNIHGEVIGFHGGAVLYTIGERHGFIITKKTPNDPRYFVISKDLKKNTITVANKKSENDTIYSTKEIIVKNLHLISKQKVDFPLSTEIRIRYHQDKQKCLVVKKTDGYHIIFEDSQNGVATGQSAVFYIGTMCLGGGVIDQVL